MRSLAESRSRLLARVGALAVAAAALAGCSADTSRFADGTFLSSLTGKPGSGDLANAAPSGHVDAQSLPAPSRPTKTSSTAAPSTRQAGVNTTSKTHAPVIGGIHVVAPGETLASIARLYGKSRVEVARANNIEPRAAVRVGQRLTI